MTNPAFMRVGKSELYFYPVYPSMYNMSAPYVNPVKLDQIETPLGAFGVLTGNEWRVFNVLSSLMKALHEVTPQDKGEMLGFSAFHFGIEKPVVLIRMPDNAPEMAGETRVLVNPKLVPNGTGVLEVEIDCLCTSGVKHNNFYYNDVLVKGFDLPLNKQMTLRMQGIYAAVASHLVEHAWGDTFMCMDPKAQQAWSRKYTQERIKDAVG